MKIRCYYLVSVAFFFLTYTALSADADLVTLLKGGQQSSEISKYLEPGPMPSQPKDEHSRTLRAVIAFGHVFEGEVTFKVDAQAKLLMWTQDPAIPPQAGVELFEKIARVLKSQYGPGKNIASIPNYGDASDVKSTAVLWLLETDIVLLKLEQYPSRAGISIVKRSSESWRSSMGADESEFWAQTLDSKMDAGPSPPPPTQQTLGNDGSESVLSQSDAKKIIEVKPLSTLLGEEPSSSMPRSIIVVSIVAALGLLWLLLKRRS